MSCFCFFIRFDSFSHRNLIMVISWVIKLLIYILLFRWKLINPLISRFNRINTTMLLRYNIPEIICLHSTYIMIRLKTLTIQLRLNLLPNILRQLRRHLLQIGGIIGLRSAHWGRVTFRIKLAATMGFCNFLESFIGLNEVLIMNNALLG